MTATSASPVAPTQKLDQMAVATKPSRRQALLYAPPPAISGPYVSIFEAEGFDVLVANSPESASVLLSNSNVAIVFALVPVLGEDLREIFRKYAPNAEVRTFASLSSLLQDAVVAPREAFEFAMRAIVATAGVLSAARGTPRERTARILEWSERAAKALRFSAADFAAVKVLAALCDVAGALTADDAVTEREGSARRTNLDVHRGLLADFIAGLNSPFPIDATLPAGDPAARPATPLEVVEAAAEFALLVESKTPQPVLALRKRAAAGEVHPMAVEALISAAGAPGTPRRGRVLVVDGDSGARNILALRLANEGYEAEVAADGRAALEIIRSNPPALIISESVLAGMDGFALLDSLRRSGYGKIPFVFLSARSDALSVNKGLLLGAADFLAKPINTEVLLTKLQKLLGQALAATEVSARISLSDVSRGGEEAPSISYEQLVPGVAILNRFRLLSDLGEGGMGKVFKARDERLEEDVVIKVMKDSLAGDPKTLAHFKREIRLARKISHPNVVRIFDFFEAGSLKFVTMEYLHGTDLAGEMQKRGAFPVPVVVRLAAECFQGLAAAHDLGVVHRDIKPHNVLLLAGGHLKILDFGIAQGLDPDSPDAATHTMSVTGTPDYMSPEQLLGQRLDARTDLYSAGVMLYQLLTAELPFTGPDRASAITIRLHQEPPPPSSVTPRVPPQLDALLLKLLARNRESRYRDAHAVIADLMALRSLG